MQQLKRVYLAAVANTIGSYARERPVNSTLPDPASSMQAAYVTFSARSSAPLLNLGNIVE